MAQQASEPLASVALEEIPISVTPTPAASPSLHAFRFRVRDDPLHTSRRPRVIVGLEPITDSVAVTTTQALDTSPLTPSSGLPVSRIQLAAATSAVGSVSLGSSALVPPFSSYPFASWLIGQ